VWHEAAACRKGGESQKGSSTDRIYALSGFLLRCPRVNVKNGGKKMCEANAYLIDSGEETLVMENVDVLRPEGNGVYLQDIFGGQRTIKARIKELNLVDHRILLETE
jgi:predicted RNA-binding protein